MAKSSWWSSLLPPTSQSFDLFPWSLHVCVGLCPGATSVSLLSIVTVFGDWCDWKVELDAKWLNRHSALISSLLAVSSRHHSSFLLNFFAAAVIPHSNLDDKILKQSLKGFEDILGRIHEESCCRSDFPPPSHCVWFEKLTLIQIFCCNPIRQSALCKYGQHIFTDQPYLAVCTLIVASVWAVYSGFSILDLPKHHLLYIPESVLGLFLFSVLMTRFPSCSWLQRGSRPCLIRALRRRVWNISTLAGCRWNLQSLQVESSQQSRRLEWLNCTLNLKLPPFVFF